MSLLKLPDTGYNYLSIESEDQSRESTWNGGKSGQDNAQFWLDYHLKDYSLVVWWKFWKPTITFKVFACGGSVEPFYQTVKLQEK